MSELCAQDREAEECGALDPGAPLFGLKPQSSHTAKGQRLHVPASVSWSAKWECPWCALGIKNVYVQV